MKIAIYKDLGMNFERIAEVSDYYEDHPSDIRLTEIVEV